MRLLTDISPEQISDGLNNLVKRTEEWPPSAIEFRNLCLPKKISPDGKNSTAYIDFKDPRHPDYQPPRIENLTQRQRREKAAKDTLTNLKSMFA